MGKEHNVSMKTSKLDHKIEDLISHLQEKIDIAPDEDEMQHCADHIMELEEILEMDDKQEIIDELKYFKESIVEEKRMADLDDHGEMVEFYDSVLTRLEEIDELAEE